MDIDIRNLHPLEIKILRGVSPEEELTPPGLMDRLSLNLGQCNQAFSWLIAKGLITETSRTSRTVYEITEFGCTQEREGTVEERMIRFMGEGVSVRMPEIAAALGVENKDVGSAFGRLSKEGILQMDGSKRVSVKSPNPSPRMKVVRDLLARGVGEEVLDESALSDEEQRVIGGISKKRGASASCFKAAEREDAAYTLTDSGGKTKALLENQGITGEEIGALTPEMLAAGGWKKNPLREYNIHTPASRVLLGRRNPYGEYLQWVKDKLCSLGFEEFDGPLVETEFWNSDALFMPQFHSARDIHDVYYVKNPSHAKKIDQPWLDRVAAAHENGGNTGGRGWGYRFDQDFTRRLILRSQGTVLSAKQLPKAKVPGKYFGIVRCFRYDQVDATHGADFYQTEGIMLGEEVNLKTLLGLLEMFATEVAGAEEVRYVPGYFPFTEPSIEVHIKHPSLGWFELGGSGIFRPEVTLSLGIEVPVLAWGLGIDRMALMHLGLRDLRDLFSQDIESVRLRRRD